MKDIGIDAMITNCTMYNIVGMHTSISQQFPLFATRWEIANPGGKHLGY